MTEKRTLYVCRPLLNGAALHKWAASQGFKSTLPANDMHATIAFSHALMDWPAKQGGKLTVAGGKRLMEQFGDAIVLRFASAKLKDRWQQFRDAGASWNHHGYKPHVTITYEGRGIDLDDVEPYRGELVFGPERFAEVKDDAADDITETKLMAKLDAADRKKLPAKDFAGPDRSYPVNDKNHARNAKARASQMAKKGLISDAQLARINAKADRVLGK